jgi:hypothetical protein
MVDVNFQAKPAINQAVPVDFTLRTKTLLISPNKVVLNHSAPSLPIRDRKVIVCFRNHLTKYRFRFHRIKH